MEKCPPAEACRDAFERMSKATVQMCMSTPGYGFSEREEIRMPLSRQSSLQSPLVPMNVDSYPQLAPKPPTKRPLPRFDMDLKELFPDDLEMNLRPSQSFPQSFQGMQRMHSPVQTQPNQRQVPFQSMTQPHHPSSQRQQLPALSSINSQIDSGLGLGGTQPPGGAASARQYDQQPQQQQPFYMQNTYNPDFMSSLPGMDFLNNAMGGGTGETNDDFNFDTNGLDLGFGMGLDLQHDWSDGQQYDLFDGFFFGNNAAANGAGQGLGGEGGVKEEGGGEWTGD